MKVGYVVSVSLQFVDEKFDTTIDAKIINIENDTAYLKFIKMSENIANKIIYRYLRKANNDADKILDL